VLQRARSLLLRLLYAERGAVLWVPSLLAATYLVLFAVHLTPRPYLFNRLTGRRLIVGPVRCGAGEEEQCGLLLGALRHGLERTPELALLDSARVARFVADKPGLDDTGFLHATRALNAQVCLTGKVDIDADGMRVHLEAWEPRDMRRLLSVDLCGTHPEALGSALADSVSSIVFRPSMLAATP
jgi:hypothetical protein